MDPFLRPDGLPDASPARLDEPNDLTRRSVKYDSGNYVGTFDAWMCNGCGSQEFYDTTAPRKPVTASGTWMCWPHHRHDEQPDGSANNYGDAPRLRTPAPKHFPAFRASIIHLCKPCVMPHQEVSCSFRHSCQERQACWQCGLELTNGP